MVVVVVVAVVVVVVVVVVGGVVMGVVSSSFVLSLCRRTDFLLMASSLSLSGSFVVPRSPLPPRSRFLSRARMMMLRRRSGGICESTLRSVVVEMSNSVEVFSVDVDKRFLEDSI